MADVDRMVAMSAEAAQVRKKGVEVGMRIEIVEAGGSTRRGEITKEVKKMGRSTMHQIKFDDNTTEILKLRKGKDKGVTFRILQATALPRLEEIDVDKLNQVFQAKYGTLVVPNQNILESYQTLRGVLSNFYEANAPGTLGKLDLDTVLFQFHKEAAMGAEARHAAKKQAVRAKHPSGSDGKPAGKKKKKALKVTACMAPKPQVARGGDSEVEDFRGKGSLLEPRQQGPGSSGGGEGASRSQSDPQQQQQQHHHQPFSKTMTKTLSFRRGSKDSSAKSAPLSSATAAGSSGSNGSGNSGHDTASSPVTDARGSTSMPRNNLITPGSGRVDRFVFH
jgi:hypothetical protein